MKSLIAITTCKRLKELQKNIIPYLQFCSKNQDFELVIALDGNEQEYIDFAHKFQIPLIYSQKSEGVGLSRNRVLESFPDYSYYFFIDDDVEIIDNSIFSKLIETSLTSGYHHFSPTHTIGITKKEVINGLKIHHTNFGGGYFLFYTKQCLDIIGGWHTDFIKYRRYGHTEHTYRAYYNNLNPSPFIFPLKLKKYILLNNPESVSNPSTITNVNQLIEDEQAMIDLKQKHFELQTACDYNYNNESMKISEKHKLIDVSRYHFVEKEEEYKYLAQYHFYRGVLKRSLKDVILSFRHNRKHIHLKEYLRIKYLTIMLKLGLKKSF